MKIRTDFVTNSSSSSFILARTPGLNERQKEALVEYVERTFLGRMIIHPENNEAEIEKAFESDWMFEYHEEMRSEARKALEAGLSVYDGTVSFDEPVYQLAKIYKDIWKIMQENAGEGHQFIALDDDLSY